MLEFLHCCLIVPVALLSGLSSGTEPLSKYVCEGDFVQLFQNVTFADGNTVNLYINGIRKELIGTCHSIQNCTFIGEYKDTVFLDEYGTIYMRSIQQSGAANYLLQYEIDVKKSEMYIHVMVPPKNECKPTIKYTKGILIASLEENDCGKPSATVHWLEHPAITSITDTEVHLDPEKEVGTYYACAETRAKRCVENVKTLDYCTTFTIGGSNSSPVSSKISTTDAVAIVTLVLLAILVIAVLIGLSAVLIHLKKNGRKLKQRSRVLDETQLMIKGIDIKELSDEIKLLRNTLEASKLAGHKVIQLPHRRRHIPKKYLRHVFETILLTFYLICRSFLSGTWFDLWSDST